MFGRCDDLVTQTTRGRPREWGAKIAAAPESRNTTGTDDTRSKRSCVRYDTFTRWIKIEAGTTGFGTTASIVARDENEYDPGGVLSRVRAQLKLSSGHSR